MTDTKTEITALRATVATLRETEEKLLTEIADVHNKDSGPPSQIVRRRLESLKAQADMVQHRRDSEERELASKLSEAREDLMRGEARVAAERAEAAQRRGWLFQAFLTLIAVASAVASWISATK